MDPYILLPKVPIIHGRHEYLVGLSVGKRVLHLGCVDTGLLRARIDSGQLLHLKLAEVTTELWGFDINAEGIETLRDLGFDDLTAGDVCQIDQFDELKDKTFDLILASEVVEHLQNPGLFLQSIQALMAPGTTQLVVTVPNAFRVSTLLWLLRGIEYVHPDHNYWFSYLTLSNLLTKNGFQIEQLLVYTFAKYHLVPTVFRQLFGGKYAAEQSELPSVDGDDGLAGTEKPRRSALGMVFSYLRQFPRRAFMAWLFRKTPFFGDGLVAIAILPDSQASTELIDTDSSRTNLVAPSNP